MFFYENGPVFREKHRRYGLPAMRNSGPLCCQAGISVSFVAGYVVNHNPPLVDIGLHGFSLCHLAADKCVSSAIAF